jgi:predicted methyltransferase MtxX (methanogen marker protein 4)
MRVADDGKDSADREKEEEDQLPAHQYRNDEYHRDQEENPGIGGQVHDLCARQEVDESLHKGSFLWALLLTTLQ